MTDEIERIRARVAKYDACGCGNIYAHGGTVEDLRTLLAALDAARDRARREAIEACIALCDREIAFSDEAARRGGDEVRWRASGIGAERVRERLRDLLAAPTPDTRT